MKNYKILMMVAIVLCLLGLILTIYERGGVESKFSDLSTYGMISVSLGLFISAYASYLKKKNRNS